MIGEAPTLADVFHFVNSFHDQCRNLIRDAVRLLRDREGFFLLTHHKKWDYVAKPNDRFLDQECSAVRRCWMTFVPSDPAGNLERGALFHLDFCRPHRLIRPALMYGALSTGQGTFDSADRWASKHVIMDVEKGRPQSTHEPNGPITLVIGKVPKRFTETSLVRIPLESLTDQAALERAVVKPLSLLLKGMVPEAVAALAEVETEHWPSATTTTIGEDETDEDEAEQP